MHGPMDPEVSYCVVNTDGRELLLRCLDAIAAERAAVPFATEVLVLDNASTDGSAEAARAHPAAPEVIALEERVGKAANDSTVLAAARGRYGLMLNEDSELRPGATAGAVHHERLSTGAGSGRRIVEFSGNRDRYVRKHHGPGTARAVRWLTAAAYAERAAAALVVPGHSPRRYWRHVAATLRPGRGEGIAEAAAAFNARRAATAPARRATP